MFKIYLQEGEEETNTPLAPTLVDVFVAADSKYALLLLLLSVCCNPWLVL